ncbi:MAG: hypothetical protein ACHQ2E_06030 [Gemmatimonadales bacterium]
MPRLTRWFLRSGLVCLLLGLGLGVAQPAIFSASPWAAALWPIQLHLLTIGWLTQLIFGVAWWLFPRAPSGPVRGSESLGWTAFWCLQTGLILRVVLEPLRMVGGGPAGTRSLLVLAGVLHFMAAVAFVLAIWPRVRER